MLCYVVILYAAGDPDARADACARLDAPDAGARRNNTTAAAAAAAATTTTTATTTNNYYYD